MVPARLWNLPDGKVLHKLDHGSPVTAVAVRADGSRLATAGASGVAKLWNAADAKPLAEMQGDLNASCASRRSNAPWPAGRATWRTSPRP